MTKPNRENVESGVTAKIRKQEQLRKLLVPTNLSHQPFFDRIIFYLVQETLQLL